MAVEVKQIASEALAGGIAKFATVKFDASYPTGGESLTPSQFGLTTLQFVLASMAGGYAFEYDYTNKKLKALQADYDATADGPLVEVGNTTDLSAVTCRVMVIGV